MNMSFKGCIAVIVGLVLPLALSNGAHGTLITTTVAGALIFGVLESRSLLGRIGPATDRGGRHGLADVGTLLLCLGFGASVEQATSCVFCCLDDGEPRVVSVGSCDSSSRPLSKWVTASTLPGQPLVPPALWSRCTAF